MKLNTGKGTRAMLLQNPEFLEKLNKLKARVKNMYVQYVSKPEPLEQALLEIYVSVALDTLYNDFNTH